MNPARIAESGRLVLPAAVSSDVEATGDCYGTMFKWPEVFNFSAVSPYFGPSKDIKSRSIGIEIVPTFLRSRSA